MSDIAEMAELYYKARREAERFQGELTVANEKVRKAEADAEKWTRAFLSLSLGCEYDDLPKNAFVIHEPRTGIRMSVDRGAIKDPRSKDVVRVKFWNDWIDRHGRDTKGPTDRP